MTVTSNTDNNVPTMQLLLAAGIVAACFLPVSYLVAGPMGLCAVAVTVGCCVFPLLFVRFLPIARGSGSLAVLLANGVRMALTLVACIVVKENWPSVGFSQFYLWVVLVYLTLLGIDTVLMLRSLPLTRKVSS